MRENMSVSSGNDEMQRKHGFLPRELISTKETLKQIVRATQFNRFESLRKEGKKLNELFPSNGKTFNREIGK